MLRERGDAGAGGAEGREPLSPQPAASGEPAGHSFPSAVLLARGRPLGRGLSLDGGMGRWGKRQSCSLRTRLFPPRFNREHSVG